MLSWTHQNRNAKTLRHISIEYFLQHWFSVGQAFERAVMLSIACGRCATLDTVSTLQRLRVHVSCSTLEGLCVEAIFSSLFQPQFRAHKPGRKIAEAASGHCHNSHTWPFGQEEVQLREFVSTLHVKPLSGPGNLAADEPHEHSESCTTPFPNSKVALASTARFAPSCMPRNRLRVMSQHCLRGKGGL